MMTVFLSVVFWVCVLGVITPYVVYPASLFLLSRLRQPHEPGSATPRASVVISAYNEAAVIREKLENACALDYPSELLEVIVISDESDDGTDEIVREFAGRSVKLFRQVPREGKSAALTKFVPRCNGDVIVFSDANSVYQPDAVAKLVRHFSDPKVGYVVGHQRYHQGDGAASKSESAYWDFEIRLKCWESRLSSVVGGDGAIMAMRRELFSPLQKDDINDFLIPLRIVVAGYRGLFDPEAVCYEEAAPSFGGEFKRKVRIVNRSFRALTRAPGAMNPLKVGVFAWQLICHKVVRWLAPVFLIGCLATSTALAASGSTFFQLTLVVQIAFYLLAVARLIPKVGEFKLIYLCYFFCLSNVAAGLGIINIFLGRKFSTWTPQRTEISKS
ncbi:Beta-monoglucosyldiacylglycerol synthase [Stieleria maiorica]|uniref:Beta-monoglucosyldiacylglycerol synthase n=1 Tax=Stieleria maiorica TaxID=2795974 RepID=A0A5B9MFP3_9BACT|nr:glycosyltransferase family 2 protein [Stieleria maiorica]QEF99653.1 Beta-monoglucosyldiacylglycerol synthase [Stieleria maiorica]